MYNDALDSGQAREASRWNNYFAGLHASGNFDGGSSIGSGTKYRLNCENRPSDENMNGFIRVRAEDLTAAKKFLVGNPIYDAGGTVEIRELPRDE
jgi:hypothetical protein